MQATDRSYNLERGGYKKQSASYRRIVRGDAANPFATLPTAAARRVGVQLAVDLDLLAPRDGFEPPTNGLTVR